MRNALYCRTMAKYTDKTPTGSLHLLTVELLRSSGESTEAIAVETGLSYSWLVTFAADRMRNPSVSKVQKLYEYLTGKPLRLAR